MKLSIITINYNNREGLRKTIESVVNQTWKDFEWIIVDGGSTDGSRELIEQTVHQLASEGWNTLNFSLLGFTAEDWKNGTYPKPAPREACPRTLLWTSEKDHGIYNAMNKGIVMADGEYCLFLNSGDCLYDSGVLLKATNKIEDFEIISFDMCGWIEDKFIYFSKAKNDITASFFLKQSLPHQATYIKKELFAKIDYYDEELKIVSDWKFFIESLIVHNTSYKYEPLLFSVIQPDGISTNIQSREDEQQKVIAQYFPPRVLKDYQHVFSLQQIFESSIICRRLYGFLYRLADLINRYKRKQ